MPLDVKPLTKAARETAIDLARTHKGVGSALEGGGRVVVVAPNLHDQRNPDPGETVVVGVYDYKKNKTLVALVHPKKKKVVAVEEIAAQFQLSDEETQAAETLAGKDKRIRSFLGKRALNPLTRLYFPPRGPQHRYAIVFARPTNSERRYAIVDLSAGSVTDVLEKLTD
jgi:hypothetical protein